MVAINCHQYYQITSKFYHLSFQFQNRRTEAPSRADRWDDPPTFWNVSIEPYSGSIARISNHKIYENFQIS